jgi:tetrahydromethanopterin S-methyltransferase subunit C
MRTLWRTTASLLRKYPILWLPAILAEVLAFNIGWLENLLRHWLIQKLLPWLSEGHSVLSNSPVYGAPTQQVMNKVIFLATPIEWGARFLSDAIFACALVATAAMLRRISHTGIGTLREAVAPIAASSRRILIFSLKIFGLNIAFRSMAGLLSPLIVSVNPQTIQGKLEALFSLSLKTSNALEKLNLVPNLINDLLTLPITLGFVYIIATLQLRLIQPQNFNPTPEQKKPARLAAIYAAVAFIVLGILTSTVEFILLQQLSPASNLVVYAVRTITSLITAIPYVPLYIAFYLIANSDSPLATLPEAQPEAEILAEGHSPSAILHLLGIIDWCNTLTTRIPLPSGR